MEATGFECTLSPCSPSPNRYVTGLLSTSQSLYAHKYLGIGDSKLPFDCVGRWEGVKSKTMLAFQSNGLATFDILISQGLLEGSSQRSVVLSLPTTLEPCLFVRNWGFSFPLSPPEFLYHLLSASP